MAEPDREQLRQTFDEAAELYDRARPGYPAELFDDLAELGRLQRGARILEIGCGTGQATVPLAERGYTVVAIDLGPAMAEVARRRLARFASVDVIVAPFETWPLPAQPFDAVVSATAFHWLDPNIRIGKSAAALRVDGVLATIATHHIAGGDTAFFADTQACYEHWDPSTPPGLRLQPADEIPFDRAELEGTDLFRAAVFRRYEWQRAYSTSEYLDVLRTYSGHRALDAARRRNLLNCISQLIDRDFGGSVTKRYLTELRVAHRVG